MKQGVKIVPAESILSDTTWAKLTANYIDNLDGDPAYKFILDLNHCSMPFLRHKSVNLRVCWRKIKNGEEGDKMVVYYF